MSLPSDVTFLLALDGQDYMEKTSFELPEALAISNMGLTTWLSLICRLDVRPDLVALPGGAEVKRLTIHGSKFVWESMNILNWVSYTPKLVYLTMDDDEVCKVLALMTHWLAHDFENKGIAT